MTISYDMLPESSQRALRLYVEKGIPTGSFLERILCNDLVGAASRADIINQHLLLDYANWLYRAPRACWGNVDMVDAWIRHRGMEGFSENADG